MYQPGLAVFSEWLNDNNDVQNESLMSADPNADGAKSSYTENSKGPTFATSATNPAKENFKSQRECALKDGKHPLWKCGKFIQMNVEERGQKAKKTEVVLQMLLKCTPV